MQNQYLSDFQIIGNSVRKFKIKNDFVILPENKNTKRKIDVSHRIESVKLSEEEFSGILTLNVKVTVSSGKEKYVIDLSVEGCFIAPLEMGEETFTEMLQLNGLTSLYSIARGFVQSTTSQTLISGSILLPMFNVAAYSKDLGANDSEANS